MESHAPPQPRPAWQTWLTWALPLLAVLIAYREAPWFSFISDDVFLIPANPFLRGPGALWRNLTHDYFWSASGNAIPYWRPVTKGSWVIELALWNGWSGGFHIDQVAIHLLGVLGVMYFVRRLGGGHAGASVAGLVYGLSPNLIEPTCSIMARSDVAVTTASLWAVVAWVRWVETRRAPWAVVHTLALVAALGSKETAVLLPAVLTLWSILGIEPAGSGADQAMAARFRRYVPYLAPAVLTTVAYFVGRSLVLGSQHGMRLVFDPARIALVGGRAFFSVLPFHLDATASSVPKVPWSTPGALASAAVGWAAFVGLFAMALRRRRPRVAVLLTWALVSLAPVLLVAELNVPVAPNLFPLAGRWVAPAVAVAAILTGLLHGSLPRVWLRTALVAVTASWSAAQLALSAESHGVFRDTESLAREQDAQFLALPEARRTLMDTCDFAERQVVRAINQGRPQEGIAHLDGLNKDCLTGGGRFRLLRLRALVDLSRFDQAFAVAEALFREDVMERRYHAEAYYLGGVAAAAIHAWRPAEIWLRTSADLGYPSCNLGVTLGQVLAQTGRLAEAALAYEDAGRCASSDARPWLAAAMLRMQAQEPERAADDLAKARQLPLEGEQLRLADRLGSALK